MSVHVSDRDYERLLELRTGLRRFLHWSEEQADALGLSASQHQLLLAVRGHPGRRGPTIGEVAESLLLRHHSAVGLVDRAVDAGLVRRIPDPDDHRVVRLRPTPLGSRRLRQLSERHLDELHRLRPLLEPIWDDLPV
jgi:DNA-binding MarR family transcriptional regulator